MNVARVDAVLRVTGTSVAQLARYLEEHAGDRGLKLARKVVLLADPRAESPRESLLRVRLVLAGLPPPVPQHVVHDGDGRFDARLDLAWPGLSSGSVSSTTAPITGIRRSIAGIWTATTGSVPRAGRFCRWMPPSSPGWMP